MYFNVFRYFDRTTLIIILLLIIGNGSNLVKQAFLANGFTPEIYSEWGVAILVSQILYNFGSLGFQQFSTRQAAIYRSRKKKLLINRLVVKELSVYTYLLPISIPIIYYVVAKPTPILFGIMFFYSLSNVYLNAVSSPIHIKSSLELSKIQSTRMIGGTLIAVVTCYLSESLILTLINESIWVLILGILIFKKQNFNIKKKYFKPDLNYKVLIPFFLPVALGTISTSLSRILAIDFFSKELLGIYFFILIFVSIGTTFQRGISIFFGPIITSGLQNSQDIQNKFILKCWLAISIFALLTGLIVSIFVPVIINNFYLSYSPSLILIIPAICLLMATMCNIWSIYFLVGGFEKYLYFPSLAHIFSVFFVYFFIVDIENFQLKDMSYFIYSEAFVTFFTPLLIFFIFIRKKI